MSLPLTQENSAAEGIKSQLSHPLCCAVTPRKGRLSANKILMQETSASSPSPLPSVYFFPREKKGVSWGVELLISRPLKEKEEREIWNDRHL